MDEELYIEVRQRIAALLKALDKAGYKQQDVMRELETRYSYGITKGTLSKAKALDKEKIQEKEYRLTGPLLRSLLQSLTQLATDISQQQPDKALLIAGVLEKENESLPNLEQYTMVGADVRIVGPHLISQNDWVLRWFQNASNLQVLSACLVAYVLLPYSLAILTGTWNGSEYPFSDSNTVLLGYPLFAFSMFHIYDFYKDLPNAFNQFVNQINVVDNYRRLVTRNFHKLKLISYILISVSIATVVYLHYNYLHDGKHSYLEKADGDPSVLFYLNIPLFAWQLFVFIYMLCAFAAVLYTARYLSQDANSNHPMMMRGKVNTQFLRPFARLARRFLFITLFATGYGIAYFTAVNNFSKKHNALASWHTPEIFIMIVPLLIYLLMITYYLYLLYSMDSGVDRSASWSSRVGNFIERLEIYK